MTVVNVNEPINTSENYISILSMFYLYPDIPAYFSAKVTALSLVNSHIFTAPFLLKVHIASGEFPI